jgi:hypothetical protein
VVVSDDPVYVERRAAKAELEARKKTAKAVVGFLLAAAYGWPYSGDTEDQPTPKRRPRHART